MRLTLLRPADALGFETSSDPKEFEEAVAWFRARVPMTDSEFEQMVDELKDRAFTVSNVAQAEIVKEVFDALDSAIADGTTFEDFKAQVGAALEESWGGEIPGRLETIFRTNVQSAYGAGRYEQMTDPAVLEHRPVWQFSAIEDDRTSDICDELEGTILPADDPFWDSHNPPLHFNCRSTVIALTQDEAQELGISPDAPKTQADDGFGAVPKSATTDWSPDFDGYPPDLAEIVQGKLR